MKALRWPELWLDAFVLCSAGGFLGSRSGKEVSGGDECKVRKALREVSDQPPPRRIILLGQETQWSAKIQEAFHELLCLVDTAAKGIVVGEPEAARQEGAFGAGEAIDIMLRGITQYKTVVEQRSFDGRYRALHARIICREKAHVRDEQDTQ